MTASRIARAAFVVDLINMTDLDWKRADLGGNGGIVADFQDSIRD